MQLTGLITVNMLVAQPSALVAVNMTLVPTAIPVTIVPDTVPVLAVTVPLLAKVTLYVAPLHTGLCAVNSGGITLGELIVMICGGQPTPVVVIVTFVPIDIPVIAVAPTVPVLAVIVAPFGLLIWMIYILPVQMPILKLAAGVAHGVVQLSLIHI